MVWRKTEHVYPRPRLGEVLVRMGAVSANDVEAAVRDLPAGQRIGEYLVSLRKISEETLYRALSLQSGIPAGALPMRDIDRLSTRLFPAEISRRCGVLPYRVERGEIHVASVDLPSVELKRELSALSKLEIRFLLVRPSEFARLSREYLPLAA